MNKFDFCLSKVFKNARSVNNIISPQGANSSPTLPHLKHSTMTNEFSHKLHREAFEEVILWEDVKPTIHILCSALKNLNPDSFHCLAFI